IIEIRDLNFKLTFINVDNKIDESLFLSAIENPRNIKRDNDSFDIFYYFNESELNIYDVEIKSDKIFYVKFKDVLREKYIVEYQKPHASSFVYLHSFIDLKKFISNESPFIYYVLYRLAI